MHKRKKQTLIIIVGIGCLSWLITSLLPTKHANTANNNISVTPSTQIINNAIPDTICSNLELCTLVVNRPQQIIEHLGYTVSYHPIWHIPNWVAYQLTTVEVSGDEERSNHFRPDPLVEGDAVVTSDYSHSGYDRGHMAPAADMKWSKQAMEESFYMTNMCPQNHSNNAGDWKDLEEFVRDLANKYDSIYISCGPIVTDTTISIGLERKIVVPSAFYKNLLRKKSDGSWTAISFIMPNKAGNQPLMTYMHSVDEVEELTGIDFFYYLPDSIEDVVESDYTISDWIL